MGTLYNDIALASEAFGETKDCSVRAIAIALDVAYPVAHAALHLQGRTPRKGASVAQILSAVSELGGKAYKITHTRRQWGTNKNVASKLRPNRTYLVLNARHVSAVVGGVLEDWTDERMHRVTEVWQIA